ILSATLATVVYPLPLHDALPIWRREVLEVGGHQDFGATLDGSCENMAVAVIGKGEPANESLVALDGRSGEMPLHERAHGARSSRSEEHTSELQSRENLVCRLLLE